MSSRFLNCLMSYLCLNNNIVSCFNYLCHVTLYLIFRIFIYHIFTHHFIFLILFIIVYFIIVFSFPCFYVFLEFNRIFIVMLSLSSWYIFIIIIISVCVFFCVFLGPRWRPRSQPSSLPPSRV